jgi:arylsulfatase A-like enzyme
MWTDWGNSRLEVNDVVRERWNAKMAQPEFVNAVDRPVELVRQTEAVSGRPNILIILCDDLNDSLEGMGGHPQAKTPHIDRLAKQGVRFVNAQANVPICGPSRASMWSGLDPRTTGYYGYKQQANHWRENPVLKDAVTLFEHAVANGYEIRATGKIHHNGHEDWSIFNNADGSYGFAVKPSWGPYPWDGRKNKKTWGVIHPDLPESWYEKDMHWDNSFGPIRDISDEFGGKGSWIMAGGKPYRYVSDADRDTMPHERCAMEAARVLQEAHAKPFVLAVGINRPHTPMYVPQEYFDRYPLESLQLSPAIRTGDLDDCSECLAKHHDIGTQGHGFQKYNKIMQGGDELQLRWTQAYLACVSYVDDQVGTILSALEESRYADNTLVIFTSDHGYHMGEKEQNFKNSVWEESMRVPFVVIGPGVARGTECTQPVSLVDLYPTCVDYGRWNPAPNAAGNGRPLDGHSLRSLLENPDANQWAGKAFALCAIASNKKLEPNEPGQPEDQHWSLRTDRYRYILCRNGEEELYDHQADPHEWKNLADSPEHAEIRARLNRELLKELNVEP